MKNFNKIYSENHKSVLGFILRKVNNTVVAEELTNDVFMKVYKHLDNYDSEKSAMNTWIMNITSNVVIDYYRKRKMETISIEHSNSDEDNIHLVMLDRFKSNKSTPFKIMSNAEGVERIQFAIDKLPEKYRRIAKLFFNEELSYQEIAETLACSLGTVKGQLSRAREILTSQLERV